MKLLSMKENVVSFLMTILDHNKGESRRPFTASD